MAKIKDGLTNWDGPGSSFYLKDQCNVPNVTYSFTRLLPGVTSGNRISLFNHGPDLLIIEMEFKLKRFLDPTPDNWDYDSVDR